MSEVIVIEEPTITIEVVDAPATTVVINDQGLQGPVDPSLAGQIQDEEDARIAADAELEAAIALAGGGLKATLIASRVTLQTTTTVGIDSTGRAYYAEIPHTTSNVAVGEEALVIATTDGRLHAIRPIGAS